MNCGTLMLMTGIQNAGPECAGFMPDLDITCAGGEYLRRVRYNASTRTFSNIDCDPL